MPKRRAEPVPLFIKPCLATLVPKVPAGDLWVHEIKHDGYRLQVRVEDGTVQLLTRTGLDWTHRFAALKRAFGALNLPNAIIDGEAIVVDEKGRSDFAKLVRALKEGKSERISFYAFDLLYFDSVRTTDLPLVDRKRLLETLLRRALKADAIQFSEHFKGDGETILARVCEVGLEGLVSKRLDKPYRSGRGSDWLKTKCIQIDEFVVGGYVTLSNDSHAIGALALGAYNDRHFVYAGRVGTGFDRETARELWQRLQPLRRSSSPFSTPLDAAQRRGAVWVSPKLVVQIKYRAWTEDGLLRQASFLALREDKPARSVRHPLLV